MILMIWQKLRCILHYYKFISLSMSTSTEQRTIASFLKPVCSKVYDLLESLQDLIFNERSLSMT